MQRSFTILVFCLNSPFCAFFGGAVWKVPVSVPPTEHGYKYRAVYVVGGKGDYRNHNLDSHFFVQRFDTS